LFLFIVEVTCGITLMLYY